MPTRPTALLLTALLLASCAAPATPIPTADPFPALLAAGDAHAANGARTTAEAAYQEAATLHLSDPAPHLRLARLYLDWNRPEEGLAAAAAAEWRGSPAAQVEPLRAALYAALEDWEETVSHGIVALALDPADATTRHRVAWGYVALGRAQEARAEYETLLETAPTDSLAHERLGTLLALPDPSAALPHLQAAGTPLASDLVAALEEATGEDRSYRLALVGQTCVRHEEWDLAALALQEAIASSPSYADAHALLGHALDQLDRPQEALPHLEAAAQLAPDSSLARSLLGLHHLQAGDPAIARPHLEAAYDIAPDNPALCLYLAYLYADLGYYDTTETWLEEAIRLAPEDPAVLEAAARFYLDRGLAEGQRGMETALALVLLHPESAAAHDILGWAQFLSHHYPQAEEHLLRAVQLDPGMASVYYHLGRVYTDLERVEEARAALTRALDLNTDPALRAEIEQALAALP